MDINTSCSFVLRDLYLHDIESCHYQILKKLGIDVSHIDPNDKFERNRQIGLLQRENPLLTKKLREVTNSTISQYLKINNILDKELIIRQYDGIIVTRKLKYTKELMELPIKEHFDLFIISIDRTMYIALNNDEITVKGVPHLYPKIEEYYKRLLQINLMNKESIFRNLQKIKDDLILCKDAETFAINMDNNKCKVFFKKLDDIDISTSMINYLDVDEIDTRKYFDLYLKPFTKSIVYEYI